MSFSNYAIRHFWPSMIAASLRYSWVASSIFFSTVCWTRFDIMLALVFSLSFTILLDPWLLVLVVFFSIWLFSLCIFFWVSSCVFTNSSTCSNYINLCCCDSTSSWSSSHLVSKRSLALLVLSRFYCNYWLISYRDQYLS